jgi:hypothetical protein
MTVGKQAIPSCGTVRAVCAAVALNDRVRPGMCAAGGELTGAAVKPACGPGRDHQREAGSEIG